MPPDDGVRLRHLEDAAERSIHFASDQSRADLDLDDMRMLAITKRVEIVGEAAKQVRVDLPALVELIPPPVSDT